MLSHTRMCMFTSRCKAVIAKLVTADSGPESKGFGPSFLQASHSMFAQAMLRCCVASFQSFCLFCFSAGSK